MIKKTIAAVALAFMIIFAGSQSNVAEASEIYIGEFDSYKSRNHFVYDWIKKFGRIDGYLISNAVEGNYSTIICRVNLYVSNKDEAIGYIVYDFRRGIKNNWSVKFRSFGYGGIAHDDIYRYSDLTIFESKLLNYILNNYE